MKLPSIVKPHEIYGDYSTIDIKAMEQFRGAMECDFAIQGALMPDAHLGYSLPIGAVVRTQGVVVPAWVGYDIGCGMCAVPTTFKRSDIEERKAAIHTAIHREVPVGTQKHPQDNPSVFLETTPHTKVIDEAIASRDGWKQLGTLGGGNHFLEVGYDLEDNVWIIIHSGSRGVGHHIAGIYMKEFAVHLGATEGSLEGHYGLHENHELAQMYIKDLEWALMYALENRRRMLVNACKAIRSCGIEGSMIFDMMINRNHNHAERRVDGTWVHRKGATHAEYGMSGVIPGNMLDGSFIVKGLGNPNSLCSSSHGAGRVLSRSQAKNQLDAEVFKYTMNQAGIASDASESTLDESPDAYKNIDMVMSMQEDLVEVITQVFPLISVKG